MRNLQLQRVHARRHRNGNAKEKAYLEISGDCDEIIALESSVHLNITARKTKERQ
jgi:hypothetical protein